MVRRLVTDISSLLTGFQGGDDFPYLHHVQVGKGIEVNKGRGLLVAHPDTGGIKERKGVRSVLGVEARSGFPLKSLPDTRIPLYLGDYTVVEVDHVPGRGFGMEKVVEGDDPLDLNQGDIQGLGQLLHGLQGNVSVPPLGVPEFVYQLAAPGFVSEKSGGRSDHRTSGSRLGMQVPQHLLLFR